jgi:hypothetical protein
MFFSVFFSAVSAISAVNSLPEVRAITYLSREVPSWFLANKCYSCHNNGDAARALYAAGRLKYSLPAKVLDDTSAWLTKPRTWHINGGDVEYKDEGLARIQFGAALVEALDSGLLKDRQPLLAAAELVAKGQDKDGAWQSQFKGDVGSPVTYGVALSTVQARNILRKADPQKYQAAISKADEWLLKAPVARVLDAAAVLLGLDGMPGERGAAKRRQCLETIKKGESKEGGWGPFVNSAPEVFDTALVLLAVSRLADNQQVVESIRRGKSYLIANQKQNGSWPETTRPTGGESYAQRISTTAWATLALLATR